QAGSPWPGTPRTDRAVTAGNGTSPADGAAPRDGAPGNGTADGRPAGRTARFSLARRRRGSAGNVAAGDVPVIETRDVSKHFSAGRDAMGRARPTLKAVDGVSLTIQRGETLALVG